MKNLILILFLSIGIFSCSGVSTKIINPDDYQEVYRGCRFDHNNENPKMAALLSSYLRGTKNSPFNSAFSDSFSKLIELGEPKTKSTDLGEAKFYPVTIHNSDNPKYQLIVEELDSILKSREGKLTYVEITKEPKYQKEKSVTYSYFIIGDEIPEFYWKSYNNLGGSEYQYKL